MATTRVDLAETADFELGGLHVSPARRQVSMDGTRCELEPRVAQVLVALAQARPDVVSRDRLVEQCWDGRIVGDDALNRCIVALRHLAQQFSPQPYSIETVPRVGYSLVEQPNGARAQAWWRNINRNTATLLLIAIALLAGAVGYSIWRYGSGGAEPASIAVLPFRNLSTGDPYFADGLSEEILGQLAREPAFRVAGRGATARFGGPFEPREVGRKLGVDYLLEGSVRSENGRLRINASLVQASDGMRLWSETYDRRLEDILEIQASIGSAVAGELRRRLVHSPAGRAINGEAYVLYLNARGLLRSGNPQSGAEALAILQKAVRLDPGYAPAWMSLAEAMHLDGRTKGPEGMIEVMPKAQAAARRAIQVDPNLASGHGMLARLLGYETREGAMHMRRAAELAPWTSEGQVWKAVALNGTDRFAESRKAYHAAHKLDPLWKIPLQPLTDAEAEFAGRRAAEAFVRKGFADDPMLREFALARVAWLSGDFSEAARRYAVVAKSTTRWSRPAQISLGDLQYLLKLSSEPAKIPPLANIGQFNRYIPKIWLTAAPPPGEWQRRNRSWNAALVYLDENIVAAKLMLNAGRADELAATYDSPSGLLGLRRGVPVSNCQFQEAALVALVLKSVGRSDEANSILRQANRLLRAAYRSGGVPAWFDDDAAQLWAVQGNANESMATLERALSKGWTHTGRVDLPIEHEPAFRSLRGNPRFEAIQSRLSTHLARERRETAHALKVA